jgi:RND family efflux transporter MFP subunit
MFRFPHRDVIAALVVLTVATAVRGETYESFTEPFRKIDLAPAESGVLAEISIHEGDKVKVGQILASLDKDVLVVSREIAAAAAEATGRHDSATAERRLREVRLGKLRELREKGHASQDELQKAEAEMAAAAGQVRSVEEQQLVDRLEIRKADAMIERRLVRSPIDGVVTRVHREQGEFVTPVAPTVVTVTQLNPLRIVFNLPLESISSLRTDATVSLKIADRDEPVAARVEFVSPIIDADSGTIRVKVLLDNTDAKWHSGQRCFLTIGESDLNQAAETPAKSEALHVAGSR